MTELTPFNDSIILRVMDGFLEKMTIVFSICAVALFFGGKLRAIATTMQYIEHDMLVSPITGQLYA